MSNKITNIRTILDFAKGVKPKKACFRVFQFVEGKLKMTNETFPPHGTDDVHCFVVTTKEEKNIVDNLTDEELEKLCRTKEQIQISNIL